LRELQLVKAIERLTVDGIAPTYEQLRLELGLASKNSVHRMMHSLRRQGHIDFTPHAKSRNVRIAGDPYARPELEKLSDAQLGEIRDRALSILAKRLAFGA